MRFLNNNSVLWSLMINVGVGLFSAAFMFYLYRSFAVFALVLALAVALSVAVVVILEWVNRLDQRRVENSWMTDYQRDDVARSLGKTSQRMQS
jgi:NADH:ubiquinone oxidoreductase subunit 6 (subunit J)